MRIRLNIVRPKNLAVPNRLTIKEMQQLANQRGGKCLAQVYVNNRTPLEWECARGHRWLARPGNIKMGDWCPYCSPNAAAMLGKEGLLKRSQQIAESRGGKCLSNVYMTARKPLEWECSKHHTWRATPDNIRRGEWCPECAKKTRAQANIKYSVEVCERYAHKRGGKLVKVDRESRRNWVWECRHGHQWRAQPSQVIGLETWCKRCQTFEVRAEEIVASLHRRSIQIVSGTIRDHTSRLHLECEMGHRWEASLASVYSAKSGCPPCAGNVRLSLEDAKRIGATKGGRCLSSVYRNARTPLVWECDKGHQWKATLDNVSGGQRGNGTWCPKCRS